MEALGRLTGGVAHDFATLLTIVTISTELALANLDAESPARKELEEIRVAADSGVALTRQLLAFGSTHAAQPAAASVNEVARPLVQMLRRLVGEHIEFITMLEGEVGHVAIDRVLLEQIVMNLVLDARDALAAGGTLTVRTGRTSPDGRFVTVAVADTGTGVTHEELPRIFEPFFSSTGYATGLGLATVRSIVHDAGGRVVVESTPGRGTTVTVYLPRVATAVPVVDV